VQLAGSLAGIFSQRLVPASRGLIPACELLINNTAVQNLIREKRTHEIQTVIETGAREGMIDMNRCLADLVRAGEITVESAYARSWNPKDPGATLNNLWNLSTKHSTRQGKPQAGNRQRAYPRRRHRCAPARAHYTKIAARTGGGAGCGSWGHHILWRCQVTNGPGAPVAPDRDPL
jgi:hypothetical protein